MPEAPDLSLPERIPESELTPGTHTLPCALYALCEIGDDVLEAHRQKCQNPYDAHGPTATFPPRPHFANESLRAVVDYHLQLARAGQFEGRYFLVCVYPKSLTLLLVTLDDGTDGFKPDLMWVPVEESGLLVNNLQIANTDWYEAKEDDDQGGPQFPAPEPDSPSGPAPGVASTNVREPEEDPTPKVRFHIQVYAVEGVDPDDLAYRIQPGTEHQKRDPGLQVCKILRLPADARSDPSRYAADIHPKQCAEDPTILKNYFIVADELEYIKEGVGIGCLEWDGIVQDRTEDELLDIGRGAPCQIQRGEVDQTATRAAVRFVSLVAQGYQKWIPDIRAFAFYARKDAGYDKWFMAIDRLFGRRGHGQSRTLGCGVIDQSDLDDPDRLWPTLIRKHIDNCKRHRFEPRFVRQYFIWCGDEKAEPQSKVELVKIDWDGDLKSTGGLAEEWKKVVTRREATAAEAHQMLTEFVDGSKAWDGIAVEA